MIQGTIIRVAGPWWTSSSPQAGCPALQEALTVTAEGTERTMEVTQHVNETTVRCIMLSPSEGLGKGMVVTATGHGLNAPVGEGTLGRMFDPLGRPIDGKGPVDDVPHWSIHRKAPALQSRNPQPRSWRPASRSLTCWSRTPRAVKLAFSAARA